VKKTLKKSIFFNKIIFYLGYFWFNLTGKTLHYSKMAMINLYCLTNGVFISKFNERFKFKNEFKFLKNESILGEYSLEKKIKTVKELEEQGYVILDFSLDEKIIDSLVDFSIKTKANVQNKMIFFDKKNIVSNIYRFRNEDLLNNSVVQKIIMDPQLIEFARDYFKCDPIFDFSAMWYSTTFNKNITDDAAQDYHFDFDTTKWLKIFIYLTDVNDFNGPHCYISSSHKDNSKPLELLKRGYVRISDEEISKYYSYDRFKEIKGKKGTIVLGDSLCWHKGKNILKENRLIFQMQFSASLFGSNTPKVILNNYTDDFKKFCKSNKTYSQNIIFK
tara:strand:- start:5626 stop:6621 length:996 start_codon:yes stop_codon:yes gene_type:complete